MLEVELFYTVLEIFFPGYGKIFRENLNFKKHLCKLEVKLF